MSITVLEILRFWRQLRELIILKCSNSRAIHLKIHARLQFRLYILIYSFRDSLMPPTDPKRHIFDATRRYITVENGTTEISSC